MKFEVGKEYITKVGNGLIIRCQFIGETAVFVKCLESKTRADSIGQEWSINKKEYVNWIEYQKPRKLEGWVNVWEWPDGFTRFGDRVYLSEEAAISQGYGNGCKLVGTVKVEWTEKV